MTVILFLLLSYQIFTETIFLLDKNVCCLEWGLLMELPSEEQVLSSPC